MDGAVGLCANLPQFALVQAIRDDGLSGELARLELRPLCPLSGVWLLGLISTYLLRVTILLPYGCGP